MLRPPTVPKPSVPRPFRSPDWVDKLVECSAYPNLHAPIMLPVRAIFGYVCDLYEFLYDVQKLFGQKPEELDIHKAFEQFCLVDRRLIEWHESLPPCLQSDDEQFIIAPLTIDLQ